MKKLTEKNINTDAYWSEVYKDRNLYISQETGSLNRFSEALRHVKLGDSVLDLGCGVGLFTEMAKEKTDIVWGVDISKQVIKENNKMNSGVKYGTHIIGKKNKKIPENFFDIVFSGETLEHLNDPNDLFRDAFKFLKSGGKLIVTTPDRNQIITPEHVWEFDHDDVEDLYRNNGFDDVQFSYLSGLEASLIIFAIGIKK